MRKSHLFVILVISLLCIFVVPSIGQVTCDSVFGVTKTKIDSDIATKFDEYYNIIDAVQWTEDGEAAWIKTDNGGVWHTNDTGITWTQVILEGSEEGGCLLSEEYRIRGGFGTQDRDQYRMCSTGVNSVLTTGNENTAYFHGYGKLWATDDGGISYETRQGTFEGNVLIEIKVNPFNEKEIMALFEDNSCEYSLDDDCFSVVLSTDGAITWDRRIHTDIAWVVVQDIFNNEYIYLGNEAFYWGALRDGKATQHILYVCSEGNSAISCYDTSNDFFQNTSSPPDLRAYNLVVYPEGHVLRTAITGRVVDIFQRTLAFVYDAHISSDGGATFTELIFPPTSTDFEHSTRLTYDVGIEHFGDEVIFLRQEGSHMTGGLTQFFSGTTKELYAAQGSDSTLTLSLSDYYAPFDYPLAGSLQELASIPGAYIAQTTNDEDQQKTVISFDNGGVWTPLTPPEDEREMCIDNSLESCSLNIFVRNFFNPRTFVWTRDTAIGIVVVRGNVGPFLDTDSPIYTYLSRDGGVTWKNIGAATSNFDMTNHGSVLVVAPGEEGENTISYSFDQGLTFQTCVIENTTACPTCDFTPERLLVDHNAVHPGFLLTGESNSGIIRETYIYHIDTTELISRECSFDYETIGSPDSDYEYFEPHSQRSDCILGVRRTNIVRKKQNASCIVPPDFNGRENITEQTCECTADDFACDIGFARNESNHCVLLAPQHPDIEFGSCFAPATARVSSSGYKKISLSRCVGGINLELEADETIEWPCPPNPCGSTTPGGNNCSEAGAWGCANATCCELVCACNPECCSYDNVLGWSTTCVSSRTCSYALLCDNDLPPALFGPIPSLPSPPIESPLPFTPAFVPSITNTPTTSLTPASPTEAVGGRQTTDPSSGLPTVGIVFIVLIIVVIIVVIAVVAFVLYKKYSGQAIDVNAENPYSEEEL
eukprot:CAMPEP_0168539262 /NCGR_PEP_ID=MMETSP0405-20121227/21719_1 /TAXON_ID=498012 /ORGANISM="Trichosphaerium sp, Strain Am-I-7 wt" /LENGTH=935 /DNA_ID=CAMNT_0008568783 /DNA_START=31 /DNA_END=2838 /DNA_ORIENTATION=+